ncbi:MAG: hypothetical protein ACJA01_001672 [Saprospiraceae bacterium]|jgi:hypothetical protein
MGKSPSIVVKLNKTKLISNVLPKNHKYAGEIKSTIEDIIEYNLSLAVYRDVQELASEFSANLSSDIKVDF